MQDNGSGPTEVAPAIGLSYSVQVGDGRSLVAQTHVPQVWSLEEINAVTDKLRKVADRQQQFGKLEAMEHDLELKDRLIKQLEDGIDAVDQKVEAMVHSGAITGGRHARKEIPAADQQQRKNAVSSLKREIDAHAKMQIKLETLRAELG